MDTQDLKAFLAVADNQSFSLGAEQIYLSQPAVSKRIANLESQLRTKLFDRISRKVYLTEAGKLLLPKARSILYDIENTQQEINMLTGELSGTLSLAISHHLGLHRLPDLLKIFADKHKGIELDVHFSDSEKAYEGIAQGHFELAINTLAPREIKQITTLPLWHDALYFVCLETHPLAKLDEITLEQLATHRCLVPDLSTFTGQLLKELFNAHSLTLKPVMSTNFLQTLSKMTEIG
ncbi:MAG: LysR family transcriptional regulator, partial [Pseudomonadota bacterium]